MPLRYLSLTISSLLLALDVMAEIIPTSNRLDWVQGVTVGVSGGIPNRTTIFTNINGGTDAEVQWAVGLCPSNQVVLLTGTFWFTNGVSFSNRSGITVRGADKSNTVIYACPNANNAFTTAAGGDSGTFSAFTANLVGSYTKGATNITVTSTNGMLIGGQMVIYQDGDINLIWTHDTSSPGTNQWFRVVIRSLTGTNLIVWPPLPWDVLSTLQATESHETALGSRLCGIENMTLIARFLTTTINWQGGYGLWVSNVRFLTNGSRSVQHDNLLFAEVRGCEFQYRYPNGTYGVTTSRRVQGVLIEDNWFDDVRDAINIEQSVGCAITYNYSTNTGVHDVNYAMNETLNGNHASHPLMNLYEGNDMENFVSDAVHGSSSHCTIFRNNFHGRNPFNTNFVRCITLDRGQWNYNIVGNVLGNPVTVWADYWLTNGSPSSEDTRYIYRFGYPNVGNNTYTAGNDWRLAASPGWDTNVIPKTFLHGNYDYQSLSTNWDAGVADHSLPVSFLYATKPSWWGTLAWPPIGSDLTPMVNLIPAHARYLGISYNSQIRSATTLNCGRIIRP